MDGGWGFVAARYFEPADPAHPLTLPAAVEANDLIVGACGGGEMFSVPPVVSLVEDGFTTPIVHDHGDAPHPYTSDFSFYAYAQTSLSAETEAFSIDPPQTMNCGLHIYRGGRMVGDAGTFDHGEYSEDGGARCGPIAAQAGGLVFFFSEIAGESSSDFTFTDDAGFVIRTQNYDGNPSGDAMPAQDGMYAADVMTDAPNGYGCQMLSFPR